MNYLWRLFIIIGLVSFLCELESCRRVSHMEGPTYADGRPLDGDADAWGYIADMDFIELVGGGIIAISIGLYLRTITGPDAALWRQAGRLAIRSPRFCPKCGRPLQINECKKENESEFNSPLLCGDCNVGVNYSGWKIFVTGLAVTFISIFLMPFIGCMGFFITLVGLAMFWCGLLQWELQLRRAKKILSKRSTSLPP